VPKAVAPEETRLLVLRLSVALLEEVLCLFKLHLRRSLCCA
jgi:hypothetical protein